MCFRFSIVAALRQFSGCSPPARYPEIAFLQRQYSNRELMIFSSMAQGLPMTNKELFFTKYWNFKIYTRKRPAISWKSDKARCWPFSTFHHGRYISYHSSRLVNDQQSTIFKQNIVSRMFIRNAAFNKSANNNLIFKLWCNNFLKKGRTCIWEN